MAVFKSRILGIYFWDILATAYTGLLLGMNLFAVLKNSSKLILRTAFSSSITPWQLNCLWPHMTHVNLITVSSDLQRVFHFMGPNLKHGQLQNGSDMFWVGSLSEEKQLRLACPRTDKRSSVSYTVMDDDWWEKRRSKFAGLSWLKHITKYGCQAWDLFTSSSMQTSVTLMIPCQIWKCEHYFVGVAWLIFTGLRLEVTSGGNASQSTGSHEAFWTMHDRSQAEDWGKTRYVSQNEIKQTAVGTLLVTLQTCSNLSNCRLS